MSTRQRLRNRITQLALSAVMIAVLIPGNALDNNRLASTIKALNGSQHAFNEWEAMIQKYLDAPIETRLQVVNDFFNRKIAYADDQEIWGLSDYWATPMESLSKGKGDCEDFVIAKYFTLRNMNVPDSQLRLIYVKARIDGPASTINQAHMVLAFYGSAEAEPRVLDNLISEILPASRRIDLSPIFSFNAQGLFAGTAPNASLGPGGAGRLSRWQDLLERARREGFD